MPTPLEKEILAEHDAKWIEDVLLKDVVREWKPNHPTHWHLDTVKLHDWVEKILSSALARQRNELEVFYATRCADHEKQIKDSFLTMLPPEKEYSKNEQGEYAFGSNMKVDGWNDYRRVLIANMDKHE